MIKKSVAIGALVGAAAGVLLQTAVIVIGFMSAPGAPGFFELALLGVLVFIFAAGGAWRRRGVDRRLRRGRGRSQR